MSRTDDRIARAERYVRETIEAVADEPLSIGHGYAHVDRVRRWALWLANQEGYADRDRAEAAALLHDIGLGHLSPGDDRRAHGPIGAEVAVRFLRAEQLFPEWEIEAIADAVRCHNAMRGAGQLGAILRDADALDALGAVGLMRAFTSKHALPEYDPGNVRGETWGLTARDYDRRFAAGEGIGPTIVDQINFQISFADNLSTESARRAAKPLVAYMRAFLWQLAREVGEC